MGRKKAHAPLQVLINGAVVGELAKAKSGAIAFKYHQEWLEWEHGFAISLSLPMRPSAYSGEAVIAVFDNLLPDNDAIRTRLAERMNAQGIDPYSLLESIGRDCVGAMQFLPEGEEVAPALLEGAPLNEKDIEGILADLTHVPLGLDKEQEFRISVAGAQEKTALLWHEGQWKRPIGTTPTTHILKPQLGAIPTAFGTIDMANSVDNEHYCLKLLQAFGLDVAQTDIVKFGDRRVLVVERFDRRWRRDGGLMRLPQEDCCQALGLPSTRKYQSSGGPGIREILGLLEGADKALEDQLNFFKSQILFWLIGATDGHGKNFSIFLKPNGRFSLTPFYDVLSAQPAFDQKQIPNNKYKLAMLAGTGKHYRVLEVMGRHFVQTGKAAGLGSTIMSQAITSILEMASAAPDKALAQMPNDFAADIHESITGAMTARLPLLENGLQEL